MDPRIADYIRANRKTYTREAITRQLVEAGHDRAEVERVWAALDGPHADAVAGERFWGRFALILIGINVAVFLAVGLLTGMLQNVQSTGFLLVILAVAMGIGALIAWGLVAATGPTKLSPTTATIVGAAIPALFALLIGGSCYTLVGSLGGLGSPLPAYDGVMQLRLGAPLEVETDAPVTCQPSGADPSEGFFLYGFVEFGDRPPMDVNVSAHRSGPGGELEPQVFLAFQPTSEKGMPQGWGHDMGPGGSVELEPGSNVAGGTVRFTDLPGMDAGGPGGTEPLDGEISWTCEQ